MEKPCRIESDRTYGKVACEDGGGDLAARTSCRFHPFHLSLTTTHCRMERWGRRLRRYVSVVAAAIVFTDPALA